MQRKPERHLAVCGVTGARYHCTGGEMVANGEGEGEGRLEITVILQTTGLASTEHPPVGSYSPILGLEWSSELNMTQLEN